MKLVLDFLHCCLSIQTYNLITLEVSIYLANHLKLLQGGQCNFKLYNKSSYIFFFLQLHPWHMKVPRLGVESVAAAGLCHSHSHTRSEPHLWPTLQQILNPLSHIRNSTKLHICPKEYITKSIIHGTVGNCSWYIFSKENSMVLKYYAISYLQLIKKYIL